MSARWSTLGVWALVMASAVYWALKLWVEPLPVPNNVAVAALDGSSRGEVGRVLGIGTPAAQPQAMQAPPPVVDTRLNLLGVLNPLPARAAKEGVALIAIDGQPAKAFRVGMPVDGDRVLQGVGPRSATLGPRGGPATLTLELPALPEAARGVPGAGAQSMAAQIAAPDSSQGASQELPPEQLPGLPPVFRPPPQQPAAAGPAPFAGPRLPLAPGVRQAPFSNRVPGSPPNQVPPSAFQSGPNEIAPVAGRQTETMR